MGETPYLVRLIHDPDMSAPHDEWDTIYKVKVADERRYDSSERAQMAACGWCSLNEHYEPVIISPDGRKLYCDNDEGHDPHEWRPVTDTIYFLEQRGESYDLVEPGLEQPEDYTNIDGIMELTERGRSEWKEMTVEQRKEIAEGELEEYNMWRRGETYMVDILKRQDECEECGHVPEPLVLDSCGGFVGESSVTDHVKDFLMSELKLPFDQIKEYTHYETEYA